jgi:hypothetical protein
MVFPSFSRQIPECYLDEAMTASCYETLCISATDGAVTPPPQQIRVYSRNLHLLITSSLFVLNIRLSTLFINGLEVLETSMLTSRAGSSSLWEYVGVTNCIRGAPVVALSQSWL